MITPFLDHFCMTTRSVQMTNPRRMTPVTDCYTEAIFISAESEKKQKQNKTELVKHLHIWTVHCVLLHYKQYKHLIKEQM